MAIKDKPIKSAQFSFTYGQLGMVLGAIAVIFVAWLFIFKPFGNPADILFHPQPTPTPTPLPSVITPTPTPAEPYATFPPGTDPAYCKTTTGLVVSCCSYATDPGISCQSCLNALPESQDARCYAPQPTPTPVPTATPIPTPTPEPSVTLEKLRAGAQTVLKDLYGRFINAEPAYGFEGSVQSYYLAWHDSYPYYSVFIEYFPTYRDKTYREAGTFGYNSYLVAYNYSNGTQTFKEIDLTEQRPTNCHTADTNYPTCYQKIRMQCGNFTFMMRIESTEDTQVNPPKYEALRIAANMIPYCPDTKP
ncbi:MAG TPA: hypothetical protein VGQ00_04695 [Candidatus Norongarragalinales archaeon]|jgi:hypothetical protein|nr:hypothetical protein [Candidatus Norongarragalinales archaeon]